MWGVDFWKSSGSSVGSRGCERGSSAAAWTGLAAASAFPVSSCVNMGGAGMGSLFSLVGRHVGSRGRISKTAGGGGRVLTRPALKGRVPHRPPRAGPRLVSAAAPGEAGGRIRSAQRVGPGELWREESGVLTSVAGPRMVLPE